MQCNSNSVMNEIMAVEDENQFYTPSLDSLSLNEDSCLRYVLLKRSRNLWGKLVNTLECFLLGTQLWSGAELTLANGREKRFKLKTRCSCIPGTSFWLRNQNKKKKKKKFKAKKGNYLNLVTWALPMTRTWLVI